MVQNQGGLMKDDHEMAATASNPYHEALTPYIQACERYKDANSNFLLLSTFLVG